MNLSISAPFRLDLTVQVLRRLPVNAIDLWDGTTYTRVLPYGKSALEVRVTQAGTLKRPSLKVIVNGGRAGAARDSFVAATLEKILGLNVDLAPFYRKTLRDQEFGPIAERFIGFRPPRFPSLFEAAMNGISCQQLSLSVGINLLNKLSLRYGAGAGVHRAFPRAEDLAHADAGELKNLGYSSRKAEYILFISRAVSEGRLDLEGLSALDDQAALEALMSIRGVGDWTAEYILLRGLGRLNVIPAGDRGIQNKLHRSLHLDQRPGPEEVRALLAKWRPYTGLMYFYFLLDYLHERSML